jgi:ribosomal-protein-alanine N-acetyltransferase
MRKVKYLTGRTNLTNKGDCHGTCRYIEIKPILRTERLTLRQLLPSDIPVLKEWMSDKTMYTYWGKPAGKTDKNPNYCLKRLRKTQRVFIGV